jgi:hypothetical protein
VLRDLRQICEHSGNLEPDDLRAAANAVLVRQFLFLERTRDRNVYRLVANHFDYFVNLFDAMGWTLHRDDGMGIIGLLPGETESFARLRLVDSLMILCLRLLYEEGFERFEVRDGCIHIQSETLLRRYETLLGRKRPLVTEFRDILARLRRHALIETGDEDDDGLPGLRILPTIRLVTDARVQERIETYLASKEESKDEDSAEPNGEAADS